MQHASHRISHLVQAAATQLDGVATGRGFETAADDLGTALRHLSDKQHIQQAQHEPFQQPKEQQQQQQQQYEQSGTLQEPAAFNNSSSSSSSSTSTAAFIRILTACIHSSHPTTAPVTAYLLSSSSGREELLAQPQLLADLVEGACAEPQGRSLAPLQEAVVALVEQAGSRLGQVPEFLTALQQQLASGRRGAGELLWGLTDTPAGRQLVVQEVLTAAATGAAACHEDLEWSPATGRQPSVYAWAAAVVALVTNDDSWVFVVKLTPQFLRALPQLLLLQLPGENTTQRHQQEGWELMGEALGRQDLLQHWRLPQQGPNGSWTCLIARAAGCTTHEAAVRAAGAAFRVLLSHLPPAWLVPELFTHQEVPALLLQLQGRLEALGDTSLLEGVGALVLRLREEDLPTAAAAYPSWQGLYEAAAQLQPGAVADRVEVLHSTGSSMAVLVAGLRLRREAWLQRFATMLSEGTDSNREQVMGCAELPGALAEALDQSPANTTHQLLVTALLQWPLGQELLCSSQQLQQAVVAAVRVHGHNTFNRMGGTSQHILNKWAQMLQAFVQHPEVLVPLLRGVLPLAHLLVLNRPDVASPYCTIAAAEGLQAALLTPEGGALDLLLGKGSTTRIQQQGSGPEVGRVEELVSLLVQWPIERVVPTVLRRLGSSDTRVVLGALQVLQHLMQWSPGPNPQPQTGNPAAAEAAAAGGTPAAGVCEAVAAAMRRMVQAGDMADLVRSMQEAAVGLAQQHQQSRGSLPSSKHPPQQQQPEEETGDEEQQQLKQTALEEAQQQQQQQRRRQRGQSKGPPARTGRVPRRQTRGSKKRQASSSALQQVEAEVHRTGDQPGRKRKKGA